jgi:molybdopterin-guanine dinucleotide biosynthesis protein A
VTNEPEIFLPIVPNELRIITDFYKNRGPIGGIHAGLSLARKEEAWIVSWDMPLLSANAAAYTFTQNDAVIPVIERKSYPFHGVYHRERTLLQINKLPKHYTSVGKLIKKLRVGIIDDSDIKIGCLAPPGICRPSILDIKESLWRKGSIKNS